MTGPKTKVVLAEDNSEIRQYVQAFLSGNDCEVVAAVSDGAAAVDTVIRLRPDILVLDISMPVLNGIQAARRLQEMNFPVKVVFLTVDRDLDTCLAALDTGACAYVLKERMASDLVPAIESALQGLRFISPGCA
jgi:DNA-binding NarL/FixJ family response regulator